MPTREETRAIEELWLAQAVAKIIIACMTYLGASPKGPVSKAQIFDDSHCRVTIYNCARSRHIGSEVSRIRQGFVITFGYHVGELEDSRQYVWEESRAVGKTASKAIGNFVNSLLREIEAANRKGVSK